MILQNMPNMSSEMLNQLLQVAGRKMGTDPMKLKNQLERGAFSDVLGSLPQDQSEMVQNMLQNPKALEQLLNTPKAQQLLKDLMGGR